MPYTYIFEAAGLTPEQYDALNRDAFPGGQLPEGLLVHVATPLEGRFQVFEVWESQEASQTFFDQRLGQVGQKHGYRLCSRRWRPPTTCSSGDRLRAWLPGA